MSAKRAGLAGSKKVYCEFLAKALAGMKRGLLTMEMPGGSQLRFGSDGAEDLEGPPPRATMKIRNESFFRKCVLFGDVGFGEAYVNGDWETESLFDVFSWFIRNAAQAPTLSATQLTRRLINWMSAWNRLIHFFRSNTVRRSRNNIAAHYDLSNELFELFLDPTLTYSCAYFERPGQSLEAAQTAKYDVLCRKLRLKPSDHVLEIGCGWGGFSLHAAQRYGCRITAITISRRQFEYAKKRIQDAGLRGQVDVELVDYRQVEGRFDKIVSIEMLEAVGHRFLQAFFSKCHAVLKPHGLLGLQVIVCPDSRYDRLRQGVDWIQKHIFPGSLLPSLGALGAAVNRTGDLMLHHLEDMGAFYSRTLGLWCEAFNARREAVQALGFDEAFIRKWNYYLRYCQAAFYWRYISVVQAIYSRPDNHTLNEVLGVLS
ncbi:MAG: cyclopropane-fatty-acyl-phospholipid synthase family protein [Acidobacteriota bacterium]